MKALKFFRSTFFIITLIMIYSCSSDDNYNSNPSNPPLNYGFTTTFNGHNLNFIDNTSYYSVYSPQLGTWLLNSVIQFANVNSTIEDCTTSSYVYSGGLQSPTQKLLISLSASLTDFYNNDISNDFIGIPANYPTQTQQPNDKVFQAVLYYTDTNNQIFVEYSVAGSNITIEKINNFQYKISGTINFGGGKTISIPTGTYVDYDCISPVPDNIQTVNTTNISGKWQEIYYSRNGEVSTRYLEDFFNPCYTNNSIYYDFDASGNVTRQELHEKTRIEKFLNSTNELLSIATPDYRKYIVGNQIYTWYNLPNKDINNLNHWEVVDANTNETYVVTVSNNTINKPLGNYNYSSLSGWTHINYDSYVPNNCTSMPKNYINTNYTLTDPDPLDPDPSTNLLTISGNFELSSNTSIILPANRRSLYSGTITHLTNNYMRIEYSNGNIVAYKRI